MLYVSLSCSFPTKFFLDNLRRNTLCFHQVASHSDVTYQFPLTYCNTNAFNDRWLSLARYNLGALITKTHTFFISAFTLSIHSHWWQSPTSPNSQQCSSTETIAWSWHATHFIRNHLDLWLPTTITIITNIIDAKESLKVINHNQ